MCYTIDELAASSADGGGAATPGSSSRDRPIVPRRLNFQPGIPHATWQTSPEGIDAGGWGMSATSQDIARFGQLYLQRGAWGGSRVLPEAWVAAATSRQVPNGPSPNPDWVQGYGYQFWRCRHDAYRGDVAFGQFCVVMPNHQAVLAITAGVRNMQAVLDLVWVRLLPAPGPGPRPEDPAEARALADRLASLRLATPVGQPTSPRATALSGREFALADNRDRLAAIRFDFAADGATLTLRDDRDEQRIRCGYGRWLRGEATLLGGRERTRHARVAASGAWSGDHTYVVDLCWYETPFRRTLTCDFSGDRLRIGQQANVAWGGAEPSPLEGRAVTSSSAGAS
jgi:hypothetical protein